MLYINYLRFLFLVLALIVTGAAGAHAQGGFKGKVRTMNGSGIPNASVTARQQGKDIKTVRADSKGKFTMTGLRPGMYNVLFDADGYSSGVLNVEVKGDSVRDLGERLILSVDSGTQVIIKGSVFFKEGTSVTGARVELEHLNGDGTTRSIDNMFTNVSGEFTFRAPKGGGNYRVTAKFKGVSGSKEIEVSNPAIYRTAITLELSRNNR